MAQTSDKITAETPPFATSGRFGQTLLRNLLVLLGVAVVTLAQQAQNPSPMVEHTRAHPRLTEEHPAGRREKLNLGTLFLPAKLKLKTTTPLLIHFHGGIWLPEVAATRLNTAVISIQAGSGSGVYAKAFAEPQAFSQLLKEAEAKAGVQFSPLMLSGWSAGYGAIREILKVPENYARVDHVLLIDGLHAGYVSGKPGPQESQLETEGLQIFLQFARDAVAGKKRLLITHSEIFPGTFASTTETTDWLLKELGLKRKAVVKWGPRQTQQLSEVKQGRFQLIGFAGNSAPDHIDQLHSLPEYLRWLR